MLAFGIMPAFAGIIVLIAGAAKAARNRSYAACAETVKGTVTRKQSRNVKNGKYTMKKVFAFWLAFCLMVSLCACGGPSDDEIKTVRNVTFDGTELTVTLGTNKSTGYEWDCEIYGDCIEPSINRSFKVTGSKGDATGEVSIGFEGLSEGNASIVCTTPNGWNGTGGGDGYTVSVAVSADGTIKSAEGREGAFPAATPEPATTPVPEPKTTIAIAELAEGTYMGTLSGDSYSGTYDDGAYSISPAISPAEISVTIQDGQVELYCAAKAVAGGTIFDVEAPDSPAYTQTVSGTLPLNQIDEATIRAEGDITSPSESTYIYWDGNNKFDRWEIIAKDHTHHCTVSITMLGGVPVAEIAVDGSESHRTATVRAILQ